MEKHCKECGLSKPIEAFHKDRSKPDGINFYCKDCSKARQARFNMRPPRFQTPEGTKRCSHCKEIKPNAEFYPRKGMHDGLDRRCKQCSSESSEAWRLKNKPRAAELQKEWRTKNKDRAADYFLKRLYGIPHGTYEKLFAAQDGKCAICGTDKPGKRDRRFHVDHDHDSGAVRGLLCSPCNLGIGQLQHNRDILWAAIEYLDRPLAVSS
jgi:Autographiviridae endonuclease VII